ncbi:MAG: carbon-nitrogen hydrolase family protein [Mycobacteriales bacterium]
MAPMRVAVVQFQAGLDKAGNLARLGALIDAAAAQGADLVITPEASRCDFGPPDVPLAPVAEPLDGPFVSALSAAASRHNLTVVAGMFEVADGSHVYNTVVALGPTGELIGSYRKQHLFDALGWMESDRLLPGDPGDGLVVPVADMIVGVMTCYDVRFPELARFLVDEGATLLAIPSAWVAGDNKLAQWKALTTARAIEDVCYVAGAVQTPPLYTGGSRIIDPWGVEIAAVDVDTDGIAVADVSPDRVAECRQKMPSLANRRWRVSPRLSHH